MTTVVAQTCTNLSDASNDYCLFHQLGVADNNTTVQQNCKTGEEGKQGTGRAQGSTHVFNLLGSLLQLTQVTHVRFVALCKKIKILIN